MQVIGSNKGYINTWNGENTINILKSCSALNLDNYQDFIISGAIVFRSIGGTKTIRGKGTSYTAIAKRRIFGRIDCAQGFFTGIHHWNEHAPRSSIQCPFEPLNTVVRNTNERCADAGIRDDSNHISHEG